MDTHHTAKDLSPEELSQYLQRLDQHFQKTCHFLAKVLD